jgi:hypothetical protein
MTRPTPRSADLGQISAVGTGPSTYEIRVAGHLDDHWATILDDLILVRLGDGTTRLTGPIVDQAQLHGLLARIRDLGVALLTLRAVGTQETCSAARNGADPKGSDGPARRPGHE